MLRIDTNGETASMDVVGLAIDRLLTEVNKRAPLPDRFEVRFGDARGLMENEVRRRLRLPGANWNLATGKPLQGDYAIVVQAVLTSVVDESAIADAFRHHGFELRLDEIARITQDRPEPNLLGLVPTHIGEMDFSAHRKHN